MSVDRASNIAKTTVYVKLLDEVVDVWRPVSAKKIGDLVYRIEREDYDPELETWEFVPGDIVRVQAVEDGDGKVLKAVAAVTAHERNI